jgi:sialic acid synthase SpsE
MLFSTPFDLESAIFLNEIQSIFKISSGDNNFTHLIELIASFNKHTMISSGLSDLNSLKWLVDLWKSVGGRDENLSILHCVSSYPVPKEQANIAAIHSLRKKFPSLTIGYSDHTLGNLAPLLAVAAGAKIIEKHFTLNKRQSDFRDHQLSADPIEMRDLVVQIREASALMGKEVKELQNCELDMVVSMRRSIAASNNLRAGKIIEVSDLTWVRPGSGIPVGQESDVVGRMVLGDILQGELITKEKIG